MVMGMLSFWRELKVGAMEAATADVELPPLLALLLLPLLPLVLAVGDVVLFCVAELSDAGT